MKVFSALVRLGVSRCCASDFYLLAQIKVAKTKGTLSCADASHRFPARLRPKEDSRKLAALRATQTSGCLFLFWPPLLGAAPKGVNTNEYRQRRRAFALVVCIGSRVERREAQRRRAASYGSLFEGCAAGRVLPHPFGASIAVDRRQPARNPGVFSFASFRLDPPCQASCRFR